MDIGYVSLRQRRRSFFGRRAFFRSGIGQDRPETASRIAANRELSLDSIANVDVLLDVYDKVRRSGGKSPGIDGIGYGDLSRGEVAAALRKIVKTLGDRSYRPHPTRSVFIAKSGGGRRELRIGILTDRVVAAAVHGLLSPAIDRVLLPTCFGFRSEHSVLGMLAAIERDMIDNNRYVLATGDVRDAFGSVPIDDALADYRTIVADEGLLWLIETILRGHEGPARTVGIDQGSPLSPTTLNLRLTACLDRPFADLGNPRLHRWADDIALPCSSVAEATVARQRVGDLLDAAGFMLKEGSKTTNLRLPDSRCELLGYLVGWGDGQLQLGIPDQAWRDLRAGLNEAYDARNPTAEARQVIDGWLGHYGACLGGVGERELVDRTRLLAASLGFREVGPTAGMVDCIRTSQAHWAQAREAARDLAAVR